MIPLKPAGIIAEFNPFHTGHQLLVEAAIQQGGATHTVAVMSGNFVQRGTPAITDKRIRARCALACGVDLVLELPLPYACAGARHFAKGAVSLLQATGIVQTLAFGSESGDAAALRRLAAELESPGLSRAMQPLLAQGMTFAKARQQAAEEELGPAIGAQLRFPNNALGVEYLRAAAELAWNPQVFTIPRQGAAHDEGEPGKGSCTASASYLRGVGQDFRRLARFMPSPCVGILRDAAAQGLYPADAAKLETAMLAKLRTMDRDKFSRLPDISEGLEHRLENAVRDATSLQELYSLLKTKRYTLARVRRLVLHAFLDVTHELVQAPPPYLRVLGFTPKGAELLGAMKQTATLPVDTQLLRLSQRGEAERHLAKVEAAATDLYTLALPAPRPCGYELSASGVFLKERN